jgi:uncharacterized cupredoxin-like copper-binding protein
VFEEIVKNGCNLNVAMGPDGALYYSNMKGIFRLHSAGATGLLTPVAEASAQAAPTATPEVLPAGTRPEDRDVNVSLSEWKLQPSRSKVPAGQIRFLAENTGQTQHALRIVGGDIDVTTDSFGNGDSRSVTLVLPAGDYRLICPIPGHEQQGMTASLTVVGNP